MQNFCIIPLGLDVIPIAMKRRNGILDNIWNEGTRARVELRSKRLSIAL